MTCCRGQRRGRRGRAARFASNGPKVKDVRGARGGACRKRSRRERLASRVQRAAASRKQNFSY